MEHTTQFWKRGTMNLTWFQMEPSVLTMKFDQIKHHVAGEVRAAIARVPGLTRQQVADGIGMSEATFSRKANGQTPFSVVDVILIAAFLGIDHTTLISTPDADSDVVAVAAGAAA